MSINQPYASAAMAEPTPVRKFLFDRSFDDGLGAGEAEKPKPVFTLEQMEATRQEAYASGFAAGQKATQDEQQQAFALFFARLEQQLGLLVKAGMEVWQAQLRHLEQTALAIVRKLMPEYAASYGLGEIQAIVAQVVAEMAHEPRLVVRVSEAQFDAVNARLKDVTDRQAYAGKVVLLGEAGFSPGDCRVEWADGGIERNQEILWQEIERIMRQTHTLPPATQPSDNAGDLS